MKNSTQHTPDVTEKEVGRIVLRDFGAARSEEVLEMMSKIEVHEKPRVMIACLKIVGGNIDHLKFELEDAPGYWREIISKAEYPLATKKWGQMDSMSETEKQEIYDKDWRQYLNWLDAT